MSDSRVMNTLELLAAIKEGEKLGLNRQLDYDEVAKQADIDGWHVFSIILPFHEAHDRSLPAHHRVSGLIKPKGTNIGIEVMFDITDLRWGQLTHVDRFIKVIEELQEATARANA